MKDWMFWVTLILGFFGLTGVLCWGILDHWAGIDAKEQKICHSFCKGGQVEHRYRSSDHCLCPNAYGVLEVKKIFE